VLASPPLAFTSLTVSGLACPAASSVDFFFLQPYSAPSGLAHRPPTVHGRGNTPPPVVGLLPPLTPCTAVVDESPPTLTSTQLCQPLPAKPPTPSPLSLSSPDPRHPPPQSNSMNTPNPKGGSHVMHATNQVFEKEYSTLVGERHGDRKWEPAPI
jgi:hypothetical protein